MPEAITIAIAVVRSEEDQFLIGPRDRSLVLGGYWEFPGGKVEEGESVEAAAIRECHEEAGIEIRVRALLIRHPQRYDHGDVDLHFFDCEALTNQTPLTPFCWVGRDDLHGYSFPSGNDPVLAMLTARPQGEQDLG